MNEESQVVLAAEVSQQVNDADIDGSPEVVLADAGYCSEANLKQIAGAEINALIATGRIRYGERVSDAPRGPIPKDTAQRERMARRLRTKAGRADYARRKAIVEPAAGQLRLQGLAGAQRRVDAARHLSQPQKAGQRCQWGADQARVRPMRASFVPALGRNTSNNESMIRNPTAEEDNLMAVSTLQAAQRRRGLIPIHAPRSPARHSPDPPAGRVRLSGGGHHPHDRLVERRATVGPVEHCVAVTEDAAVGGDQPVAVGHIRVPVGRGGAGGPTGGGDGHVDGPGAGRGHGGHRGGRVGGDRRGSVRAEAHAGNAGQVRPGDGDHRPTAERTR